MLKKAGVVDAGAKGLHSLHRRYKDFSERKASILKTRSSPISGEKHVHIDEGNIKNRYCTEAIIEGSRLDVNEIKSIISQFEIPPW